MAKQETAQQKKIKDLLSELASKDAKRQLKAVQGLKTHGNEKVIEPLLVTLVHEPETKVADAIVDLLNTPKSTRVPSEIAKALVDKRFIPLRHTLLTTIWNSGLDYRPHLKEIMTVGVEGEMMEALECITILENLEGDLTEDEIFEPLIILTEYINENKSEEGPKMDMIREATAFLQTRNNLL